MVDFKNKIRDKISVHKYDTILTLHIEDRYPFARNSGISTPIPLLIFEKMIYAIKLAYLKFEDRLKSSCCVSRIVSFARNSGISDYLSLRPRDLTVIIKIETTQAS